MEKKNFLHECCFIRFCWVLFFIHCEYGIGLKVEFLVDQLRNDYFGNLSKAGSVVGYLFVIGQCPFLLHICVLFGVMFRLLQGKILYFLVFQL